MKTNSYKVMSLGDINITFFKFLSKAHIVSRLIRYNNINKFLDESDIGILHNFHGCLAYF